MSVGNLGSHKPREKKMSFSTLEDLGLPISNTYITPTFLFQVSRCSDGWVYFADQCYYFDRTITHIGTARTLCQSMNSYMVIIGTDVEKQFIIGEFFYLYKPKYTCQVFLAFKAQATQYHSFLSHLRMRIQMLTLSISYP